MRTPSVPKFNVKRADWVVFSKSVKPELVGQTINDRVNKIQNSNLDAAIISIPKTSTDSFKHRVPCWTPDCRRALCERNKPTGLFKLTSVTRTFATTNKQTVGLIEHSDRLEETLGRALSAQ